MTVLFFFSSNRWFSTFHNARWHDLSPLCRVRCSDSATQSVWSADVITCQPRQLLRKPLGSFNETITERGASSCLRLPASGSCVSVAVHSRLVIYDRVLKSVCVCPRSYCLHSAVCCVARV